MPEQPARTSAGAWAQETRTKDRNLRHAEDFHPAGYQNLIAPGERNLRAVTDTWSGSERGGLDARPRRTIVIRGQVADRYSVPPRSSGSLRASGSYAMRLRPERAALWAVLLGLVLLVAALASAHL